MGFLPFVNKGGKRITRWFRLVLAWLSIVFACLFGSCGTSYLLVGDFRAGVGDGLVMGMLFPMSFIGYGLSLPVQKLPPLRNCR